MHLVAQAVPARGDRRGFRGVGAGGAAPAGGPFHVGVRQRRRAGHHRGRPALHPAGARGGRGRDVRRLGCGRVHRTHPRRGGAGPGPGGGAHRRRLCDQRLSRQPRRGVPAVSHRLGPDRRGEGRLRVLHAQGDRRAARRGGRHPVGAFRRRPHRARRAAAVRSGAARGGQGVRGGLRHRLSLRAAGQVRHRALDPAAGGGGAGQRVPLPRPGAGPQHPGGGDQPVRGDRRHAGGGAPRQGAEGQGAGHLQHQRLPDSAGVRRGALHPGRTRDRGGRHQDVFGADRRQLSGRAGAGAGPRHQIRRRSGPGVPGAGSHARAGGAGAGRPGTRRASWPAGSRRPRRCCSWAATSATRWRWRARSSSRSWPTCTPRGSPPASSNTARSR